MYSGAWIPTGALAIISEPTIRTNAAGISTVAERGSDSIELAEAKLLKAGQLLAEAGEIARSINIYSVCSALHPGSWRALAGLAEVNAKIGRTELATTFYTDAIKKLGEDKSLDDAQRKPLAAAWESALRGLASTFKSPVRDYPESKPSRDHD